MKNVFMIILDEVFKGIEFESKLSDFILNIIVDKNIDFRYELLVLL